MANAVYNMFKKGLMAGTYDLTSNVYCALVAAGYTADVDTHDYFDDVSEVVTPSNYTASFALSAPVVTTNGTNNQGVFDADDVLIANVTFGTDVRAGVLFQSTGSGAAADPLIAYIDFGSDQAVTAGTFQITWDANGILALT